VVVVITITIIYIYFLAEHQSQLLSKLRQGTENNNNNNSFILSIKEVQILNRGRNAVTNRKNTNHRHHPNIYQDSTAFEALIGYLYISDMHRCMQLLHWIDTNIDIV
jgi:23S rRNA maturation mini-RNase III